MEIIQVLICVFIGVILSWIILSLINKVKRVSKTDYENLKDKLNEVNIMFKISEDRSSSLKQDYFQLQERFNLKDNELNAVNQIKTEIETRNSILNENVSMQKKEIELLSNQITLLKDQILKIKEDYSALSANHLTLSDKLKTQKDEIVELHKTSQLQFETIANKIFEEKSGKFTDINKYNIEAILKPLGENIENFKKKVEETYDKESKQRFSLEDRVKELIEQTNKISKEANNLATALKGQPKKQGNWGEMILESILQNSGLVKDREYFLQPNMKNEDEKNIRPDVVVKLPDNRDIIIDSKVSLVAYDRFSSAETPEDQSIFLSEHLKSIYIHIDGLSGKQYDNLETSLDFTMMFIPIEPAYLIAIQGDADLWAYAYKKRILLISPTNLIACLKLMADLWKREQQSKNAKEIVKRGELLYEKIVAFVGSFEEIGKTLNKAQITYNDALGKLNTGGGNIVGQALKLRNLGLKSSKEMPKALLPSDFDEEDIKEIGDGNEGNE